MSNIAGINQASLYHRTPEKSTIEEDAEEECESDLYKQYSHLVYDESDPSQGLDDKSHRNSSQVSLMVNQKAPKELLLDRDDPDSVAAD